MTTSQKGPIHDFEHLRPDVVFLLAPKMTGCVLSQRFPGVGRLVGRQTPVPSCQFNEESTFDLTLGVLGV
jgi:hypothetical protein